MDSTNGVFPRPPTGKPPSHLPARRPGCRYLKRREGSTFSTPPSVSSQESSLETAIASAGAAENREATSASRAPDSIEQFGTSLPSFESEGSRGARTSSTATSVVLKKRLMADELVDAESAVIIEQLVQNRRDILAAELLREECDVAAELKKRRSQMHAEPEVMKSEVAQVVTESDETLVKRKMNEFKNTETNEEDNMVNDENEDGSCNRATDGPLGGELEYSQASETGCETTTGGLETPSESGASSPEPCQRPTDWECVSVTAIAELEMMKEDLEHFLFENLEKFGRLLNLESKHSGRDNASLSRGANKLASLLSTEFEEDEYDDDDEEPCFCPPISDVNEIYDYWDIISGSLVWSPPSARVDTYTDTTEQETARSMVDETINGSPRKVSSQCPTLGMILEEDEDEDETAEQNSETSVAEENDVVGVPSSPTPAKGPENDTTDHNPESIVAGDNDEEKNDSPTLVALPSPPIPVEHYARTLASTLLASTLQQISDEASPTSEQDANCDTSVSTDTCIGDSSGSSVTIYERTTASNTETSDLATISEDTEATETSISPSAADSAASKETVPMPASFHELSDRQLSFQGTVLEDGEPQSHPSVILAEQDIAEKHETCSAPGLLLSNGLSLANNDQQTTTALVATASSAPCVTETSGSHSTGGIDDLPQQESTLPSDAGDNADLDDDVMVFRSKSGELVHIVQLSSDTQPITSEKATSETQATTSQKEDRNETGVTEPETEGFASSSTGTGLTEDEVRASEITPESSSQKLSADTKGTPQNPPHVADEIKQLLGEVVDLRGGTRATQLSGGKPGTSDTRASSDMNTELAQHCTEYPTTGGRPATDTPEQSFKDAKSKETIPTRGPVRVKGPERTNIKFEDLLHNSSDCETASSTQRLASFPCRLTCGNSLCGACPQCKADKKSCVDTRFPADSTSRQTCNSLATLNGGHMCSVCTTQSELRTDGGCSDAKETVVWVPLSDIVRLEDNTSPSITAVRSVGEKQAQRQNVCTDGTKRSKGKKMSANRQVSSDPGMAVRGTDEKKVPLSTQTQAVKETASPKQLSKRSAVLIKGSSTPTGARKGPCGAPKSPPASASNYKQAVLKAKSSLGGSPLPSKLKTFGKSAPSLGAKGGTRSSKELKELPKSGATTGPVKASSDVSNMKKKTSGSATMVSERQMNLKTKQETPDIPTTDNMETKTSKRRLNSPHKNGRSLLRRHTQPEPLAVGQSKEAVCGSTETSSLPAIPVAGVKEDCVLAWMKACHEQTEDATTAEHGVLHETERVGTNKDVTGTQSHTIFHHEPQVVAKPDTLSLPILPLTGVSEATSAGFAKAHSVAASHAGAQLKDKACKSRPKSTSLKRRSGRLSEPGSNRLPSLVLPSTPTSLPALPLTGSREEHNSQNLFKASGKAMTQIAVAEDGETCPSSGGVCVAASQPYEDHRSNEVVLQETATAQGWADMPMKSKSEAMSNRLPPLPPPGPFFSLPKLPLTEDGTGYDAEAWIRANCDRVKQITSQTRGDSCDLHSLPMAEIRGMEMSTMKEARAFLKKKASRPTSAHISQPNTSQDTIDTHTRDSEKIADGSELKCAQATEAKQPEEFTLPKIPLTSDGKGYDATAWIRANAGRVKEMYAARQSNIRMIQSDTASCGVLPQIKTKGNTSLPDIHC